MKKLCKISAAAVSLLCLIVMAAGCGTKAPKNDGKIKLCEVTHSVFYAPLYATIELGYFNDEGLDVELINGGGADKVMIAVITGEADIGFAGPEACIYTYLEGQKDYPKVFGQLTKRDGSFLIGRTDEEFRWENLAGKTILGGRKGGVPEMTLEYVLKQKGLQPGVDVTVDTSVQFDMMAGAFVGGTGDYVTMFEPTATETEAAHSGYVLASIGEESGEIPYTAFFARQSYLQDQESKVSRFTAALTKGMEWVSAHDAQEVAQIIRPQFPGTSVEVLANVVQRYKDIDAWNSDLCMQPESLDRLQAVMQEAGELKERVDFQKIVDNTWAEKARG
ncbi:MAG: ABC transporter substrate-binding protein [Oscillospiraceae bacterium]|nr:ABC transporter substrate-binding protein [Oscillospiraceae bacterium]